MFVEQIKITDTNGATIAVGQQLDTASLPVVLPAAQISAITPPAAITGFALDTSVNTLLKPADTLTKVTTVDTITNPVAVTGTFFQATQPVYLASIPLAADASTATLQTTGNTKLDTLDTSVNTLLKPASTLAGVTTVSAVTAITNALPSGNNIIGSVRITDGTNTMPTMDAIDRRGFQSITDGTNLMPTMDTITRSGFQKITDGTNTVSVVGSLLPATATDSSLVVTLSPNISTVSGSIAKAEDAVHTSGDVGMMSLGVRNDALTTLPSANGDYAPFSLASNGSTFVTAIPQATNGLSFNHRIATASNNATVVKNSAGNLYTVTITNAAVTKYLKLYNKATAPVPATDTALLVHTIGVQANTTLSINLADLGISFSNGIAYTLTTAITDTDNTSTAANTCVVDITYK